MDDDNYKKVITVLAKPQAVYEVLTEGISKWWGTSSHIMSKVDDETIVTFDSNPTSWKFRAVQLVPEKLVAWECVEANHIHEGLPDTISEEWVGTKLIWQIDPHLEGARVFFTHEGLVPSLGCYENCEAGWDHYIVGSLNKYLNRGAGIPGHVEK
ncbi:MAG: SRPBCC domain-containing protein [Planctomycetota bacterium]|nr:SRPBCC domain-containing protein [Planctomycetota bacterium]